MPSWGQMRAVASDCVGTTANVQVIRWGGEEARTGPWRGDHQVAYLNPAAGGPAPSAAFVRRCLDQLAANGFSRVVTAALAPLDQAGFLGAGFHVEERLRVLVHDLDPLPEPPFLDPVLQVLRRCRDTDRAAVLDVDHQAFGPFWQLDQHGLEEALGATPHARFRVVSEATGQVVGYAITGRAGRRGFVQRLAVGPQHQGRGLGRALVLDGLRWLRRWRVERAVVNTQVDNDRALALYAGLGFRSEAAGLSVLSLGDLQDRQGSMATGP